MNGEFIFTVKRVRNSVTQGEAVVYLNGEEVGRFGDTIELIDGEWKSSVTDSEFLHGVLFHPYDNIYGTSNKVRSILKTK